jgi:RNA polymerase sigma-70 factor (ECF subfamily)
MWPDPAQTGQMLDQVRRGEPAAVDQLLACHREPLRRVIGLRLDPALAQRVDASDVVQDVILEASQRLAQYLQDPRMPFHLWLRHIAQDHIIDAHRKHRLAQRRSVDREQPLVAAGLGDRSSIELAAQLVDPEMTPATAALRQEVERRLAAAVGQLGDDDREVILMRHYEQLSNQEVAATLGLSEAAAAMRYLRALRRLRAQLHPAGPEASHE